MQTTRTTRVPVLLFVLLCLGSGTLGFLSGAARSVVAEDTRDTAASPPWQAGVARVVITPREPMWMSGYGGRDRPAEGKVHDLYARAAALRDPAGKTAVFVATDLIGVPASMSRFVAEAVEQEHGIPRRRLMLTCSHTHCGPALDDRLSHMLDMQESDWQQVREYQKWLNQRIVELINAAVADLEPARLSTDSGVCRFAANRRAPKGIGPYDHQVPVLKIESLDGSRLRGVVFGYACHNTTLSFYQWCGDYSGFAQLYLEDRHPDAVAMFFTGGGGDQNPLPRRKLERARKYGRMLATAVDRVLKDSAPVNSALEDSVTEGSGLEDSVKPVTGRFGAAFEHISLPFESLPSREQLEAELEDSSRYRRQRARLLLREWDRDGSLPSSWPYPVQVWRLGRNLTWVALGGELVVEYQLRLKKELDENATWVTGYANDVMAYIPSERILEAGGYEGDTSMIVYQLPSKWKPGLENRIVSTVHRLAREASAALCEPPTK